MAILALQQVVAFPPIIPPLLRLLVPLAAVAAFSRRVLHGRVSQPLFSVGLGLAVFAIWVGPDVVVPGWRHSILFNNALVGHPAGNTPPAAKSDALFLILRVAVSVIAVPILEELFWRGWLMRWIVDSADFRRVALGTYAPVAFWITAVLFASEHGSFWDVGLLAGIIYNWWMVRTRNLWDCIVAHAVTNGALAVYVIGADKWQYWL